MRWIDLKGDEAEQMMRYAFVLHLNNVGEEAGAVVADKWIGDIFQNLPGCATRKQNLGDRLKRFARHGEEDCEAKEWMNYENVEELGATGDIFRLEKNICPKAYPDIISLLEKGESVAVHVLSPTKNTSTCTHDYYNWAVAGIRSWIDNPHFVVITDDMKWAKENILMDEAAEVDWIYLPTKQHNLTFDVLRHARHNIMSNNLASWWGAWLNDNPDKIVIAPKIWNMANNACAANLIPLYWTTVPIN